MLDFGTLKSLKIGGVDLERLTINGVLAWKKGFKNWAFNSLEAGGASIYNGGKGYKTGYRIRSGGAEGTNPAAICTGFIPFKIGDTIRIFPQFSGNNTENSLTYFDGSFAVLGQRTHSGSEYGICHNVNGVYKTTIVNGVTTLSLTEGVHSADIRYVRVTNLYDMNNEGRANAVKQDISNFIITVNEEFEVPV